MNLEKVEYGGWPNCYRLSNDEIELIATTDVGPRLIRFGFIGGANEFKEFKDALGKTGGDEWRSYGGHRLWHAPEEEPRTYVPDNAPVELEEHDGFIRLRSPREANGLQKELDVSLDSASAHVRIVHRLINRSPWTIECAPWALSVMTTGGTCIFPLPPRGGHPEHLAPASSLTLWKFTDMSDARWTWGHKYIMLRQDQNDDSPQKVGASVVDGWAGYANEGRLFLKTFTHDASARYADMGVNFETFTNESMLEVETLGPLQSIAPGQSAEHVEEWFLFRDVPVPQSEADIDRDILPRVQSVLS
ncbi:MAG: hypothetical protein JWN98_2635 [Abditibacteriota bacterium]|nr:hypothetical protein [Abditibacteriota bacterium]